MRGRRGVPFYCRSAPTRAPPTQDARLDSLCSRTQQKINSSQFMQTSLKNFCDLFVNFLLFDYQMVFNRLPLGLLLRVV